MKTIVACIAIALYAVPSLGAHESMNKAVSEEFPWLSRLVAI